VTTLLKGLENWMDMFQYPSIKQMHGAMSQQKVEDPAAFERANYLRILNSMDTDQG